VFDNAREKLDAFLVKDDLSTRLAMLTALDAVLALGTGPKHEARTGTVYLADRVYQARQARIHDV
jgi:hypothetical protein